MATSLIVLLYIIGMFGHLMLCKYTRYKDNLGTNSYTGSSLLWPLALFIVGISKFVELADVIDEWVKPTTSKRYHTKC